MTIASTVQDYLDREGINYGMIAHEHTNDSSHTAQAAHVPGDRLAKCVMLEDEQGYLMAVVPSTHRVDLGALHRSFHRNLGLATDSTVTGIFKDCEPGAAPPLGRAYGIDAVLDESLVDARDVYFESGDHMGLVHVSGSDFLKLMANAPRGRFSHRV